MENVASYSTIKDGVMILVLLICEIILKEVGEERLIYHLWNLTALFVNIYEQIRS